MNDNHHGEKAAPSRSARKRAARSVEDLAVRLTELAAADFRRLPVEGDVRRELEAARSIKAHGARKRQIKHLAGLLRRDEETREALEGFVSELDQGRFRDAARFHFLEELRERLCDPNQREDAMEEVRSVLPDLEEVRVRRLAEAAAGGADKRAFRELFRVLKAAEESLHQPPK
ncbi:MAG: ribosome biogenesis factor YjgA [Syntrophotaleaceae bacterium]